jgi:hypothetical protein
MKLRILDSVATLHEPTAVRAPNIYGNSYIVNGILLKRPTSSNVSCEYAVNMRFVQDESQAALTELLKERANAKSMRALADQFAEGSVIDTNIASMFSPALEVSVKLSVDQGDESVVFFDGPIVTATIDPFYAEEDGQDDSYVGFIRKAVRTRYNTVTKKCRSDLQAYGLIMERHATVASSDLDDTESVSSDLQKAEDTLAANIVTRMDRLLQESQSAPAQVTGVLSEIVDMLYDLAEHEATQVIADICRRVNEETSFIEIVDEDEESAEGASEDHNTGDADAGDGEDEPEVVAPVKRRGRPAKRS